MKIVSHLITDSIELFQEHSKPFNVFRTPYWIGGEVALVTKKFVL